MTRDHIRRLLPAAIAAVTLATSAPLALPHVSHAAAPPVAIAPPPGKIPTLPRADTTRGLRVQGTSST